MNEKNVRLRYLLQAYITDRIAPIELSELKLYVSEINSDEGLYDIIDSLWSEIDDEQPLTVNSDLIFRKIINDPRILADKEEQETALSHTKIKLSVRWVASIAAMLLVAASVFVYFYSDDRARSPATEASMAATGQPVLPGGNKAMLTLADGRVIALDDIAEGSVVEQDGFRIVKTNDGQILYEPVDAGPTMEITYNTVNTPKGGEYRLVLPDGTKVWLNAASSLRYPVQFSGKERLVDLTGEAYFEVSHVKKRDGRVPFVVRTAQQEVEVLGTHFNIKAYPEEAATKTTLLEGSVRVSLNGAHYQPSVSSILKPNQQATIAKGSQHISLATVDPINAVAWKDGNFAFHDNTIVEVMNTIARWYDVEVEYEGDAVKNKLFGGTISKFESFEKLLKTIELTGTVKFKIDGRRVIVMT